MLRKELLDARKALRSTREGASGPRSKKHRGEWELASIQNTLYVGIKWFVGDDFEVREGLRCCREL